MSPGPDDMKALLACLGLMIIAQAAPAADKAAVGAPDWPQFRGPGGQGVSNAKNVPRSWGKEKGVAWKRKLPGKGWSSPVISEGKVVMTASKENDGKITLGVVAVDQESGDILWDRDLFNPADQEARKRHAKNGLSSATPYLKNGVIYAHFGHMGTAALKLESGEVIWRQKFEYKPLHGTGSSPVIIGDLLVFHADGTENPVLVALDAKTGDLKWKTPRNQEVKRKFSFSTPLELKVGGESLILSPASGMVGAYRPADGKLVWKVTYGEGYSVVPRPVFANGLVYVATGFGVPRLMAIDPKGSKGDVTKSKVVWDENKNIGKTPSFVAAHGSIYIVDDNGTLSCRDGKTGELRWKEKLPGNFSSSPVIVGNTLYSATEDGVAYVLEVSPKACKVLAEIDMEERIFASPAVIDGAIFIRSEEHLWKIGG
ncbi:MAG: PQQ-binding-like beta-propeller repeat protein [Roseibacillus sp.]